MKKYFPTFLSKSGEFKAISNLPIEVKDTVAPIIQALPNSFTKIETQLIEHWNFDGNKVFLDFSSSQQMELSSRENLITTLRLNNVNPVPIIDINSSSDYREYVENLIGSQQIDELAIRFSNQNGGFININQMINIQLQNITNVNCDKYLILDYGYIDSNNINIITAMAINTIQGLNDTNIFTKIIVASSSFLSNLSSLTPADRVYRLPRLEWDMWLQILENVSISNLGYSDYGTKHPIYSDTPYSGTCSIKYSTEREYVIYRGELSQNHPLGNGQYITFAERLINSNDYSGSEFSWGDSRIEFYANEDVNNPIRKTGNAETWVSISQNHHITLLNSLL